MTPEHAALVARLEAFPMFLRNGAAWIMSTHKEPLCGEAAAAIRALAGEVEALHAGSVRVGPYIAKRIWQERDDLRDEVAALKAMLKDAAHRLVSLGRRGPCQCQATSGYTHHCEGCRALTAAERIALALAGKQALCDDCPPFGYPTDETRCAPCPRRNSLGELR